MLTVRRLVVVASAAGIAVGVAGCTNTVSASDVAQQAKQRYNQNFAATGQNKKLLSVSCPSDLQSKVGAFEVCTAIGDPGHVKLNITATVSSVTSNSAHVEYNLTKAPASSSSGTSTG